MKNKAVYLPGLNGLRAIAALAVVFSHTTHALHKLHIKFSPFGVTASGAQKGYPLARNGVTIFFVLSGFLITYLLQLESDKQPISLRKFYIRRILRIWPLYYLYLSIVAIVLIYLHRFQLGSFFYYIFFAANIPFILQTPLPYLVHFWSIGVEEQFYLFWPVLMKRLRKHIVPILVILILLQLGFRVVMWYYYPYSTVSYASIVNRFDAMMIGALGAIFYKENNLRFLRFIDNKFSQFIAWTILLLFIIDKFHVNSVASTSIISIVSLILIVGQINKTNRLVNLDNRPCDFLGKISYGIYVYHPLVILLWSVLLRGVRMPDTAKAVLLYLSVGITTILLANISFAYFEQRFIKLKSKFAIIKSQGYKE